MGKMTKAQARAHREALGLVRGERSILYERAVEDASTSTARCADCEGRGRLDTNRTCPYCSGQGRVPDPEIPPTPREWVLENFREDGEGLNNLAGAYFTPRILAQHFALDVLKGADVVLDLCAGIGSLGYAITEDVLPFERPGKLVCVEKNPLYVEVGKFVLPDAVWICADVFDTAAYEAHGPFEVVISNPPFGRVEGAPKGRTFDEAVVELAVKLASFGVFILPAGADRKLISQINGINLRPGLVDPADIEDLKWRGAAPKVEIRVYNRAEDELEAAVLKAVSRV